MNLVKSALAEQYHAGLTMLAECVTVCPNDVWLEGDDGRPFWLIVWHSLYYTHRYMVQDDRAFNVSVPSWPEPVKKGFGVGADWDTTKDAPHRRAKGVAPPSRQEMFDYLAYVRDLVDATVASLDLDRPDTGIAWYPDQGKLSHELGNLRHLQGHVGQLSERLMAHGIDTEWYGK